MAKDPAFLFYPNDWLGGTLGMSFEEKGAYMELLMLQFNTGHMRGHMIGQVVGQNWDKIKHKFIKDKQGLWYNVRLEVEKNKRKAFTNSRKNNLKGKNQHTKNGGHTTPRMEDVNENTIKINKESVLSDEIWKDSVCLKHGFKNHIGIDHQLKEFDNHLISIAESHDTVKEYKKHFNSWLNKQDISTGTKLTGTL